MSSRSVCVGVAMSAMLYVGSPSSMAAISLEFAPVDTTAVLAGYKTYDMLVTTDADWTAAAMLFELSDGSLYQHAQGADTVTDPAAIPTLYAQHPGVAFDTYVIGSIAGAGGDIGRRQAQLAFDTERLDVSWYNLTPDQVGTTTVARLTLTDDAAGLLKLMFTIDAGYREPSWARFDVQFVPGAGPVITQEVHEVFRSLEISSPGSSSRVWVLPDGTRFWTIDGQPPAGFEGIAVPAPDTRRDYDYSYYSNPLNSWLPDKSLLDGWPKLRSRHDVPALVPGHDPAAAEGTTPEPGTLVLIGLGTGAVLLRRR